MIRNLESLCGLPVESWKEEWQQQFLSTALSIQWEEQVLAVRLVTGTASVSKASDSDSFCLNSETNSSWQYSDSNSFCLNSEMNSSWQYSDSNTHTCQFSDSNWSCLYSDSNSYSQYSDSRSPCQYRKFPSAVWSREGSQTKTARRKIKFSTTLSWSKCAKYSEGKITI